MTIITDQVLLLWEIGKNKKILEQSCDWERDFFQHNFNAEERDHHLCDIKFC